MDRQKSGVFEMVKVMLKSEPVQLSGYEAAEPRSFTTSSKGWQVGRHGHIRRPPTDVYETPDALIVRMEIAGMHEDDFSISLSRQHLAIRGIRPDVSERRAYHQMEISFGEFLCEVDLHLPVILDQVQADYQRGFLRVVLPKQRAQKIHVEAD
jgi:HSP20 family protein